MGVLLIGGSSFFAYIGFTAFEAIGMIYVQDTFFLDDEHPENTASLFYSNVISGAGVTGLVTNLFVYSIVQRVTGLKGSIAIGGVLKAGSFAGVALSGLDVFPPGAARWGFFAAVQLMVFGDQVQCTSIQTMMTTVVDKSQLGKAMGFMNSCSNMARALGPLTFGPVYEHVGHAVPWDVNVAATLIAATLPLLVRRKKTIAEDAGAEARDVVPSEAPIPMRQLSSHTTRSVLTNVRTVVGLVSTEDTSLRRTLSWGGSSTAGGAPLMARLQRARSAI